MLPTWKFNSWWPAVLWTMFLDLIFCSNSPNVSIPEMANQLIGRTTNSSWVVVFKALITIHDLMNYGNEVRDFGLAIYLCCYCNLSLLILSILLLVLQYKHLLFYYNIFISCLWFHQSYFQHCFCHSFIHSGYFYSSSSSPLLLRGAPDTARILCRNFTPKRQRQLWVKDLPKVPTQRLERESNPWPLGRKELTLPMRHPCPHLSLLVLWSS